MRDAAGYALIASCGVFLLFFANVVLGSLGKQVFLSDIQEMLTLFVACMIFVICILLCERKAVVQPMRPQTESTER